MKLLLEEIYFLSAFKGSEYSNLNVDNQSVISLIENHDNHKRSKHIALRNNFYREQYVKGLIEVIYVSTNNQLADSLTKPKSSIMTQ